MSRQVTIIEALLLAFCICSAASLDDSDVAKRAPSGFMGMRGKKQGDQELVFEDNDKRAPGMGFQGMRGKKDQDDGLLALEESDFYEKRAPGMGFQGMRGKKDGDMVVYNEDKRAPGMGFQGMRGKKDQNLIEDPDFYEKRAPGMGFQGMRGKKDSMEDYKRAPSMGFQGMRGKKDQDEPYPELHNEDEGNDYTADWDDIWGEGFEKRAPSGFFGMRGKKEPKSGFFGMRGKKAPSGFMGMRGKKAPSGFMGMRGKKSSDMDMFLESLEAQELRDEANAQLRGLEAVDVETGMLRGTNVRQKRYKGPTNIKKAPSGFIGMRGKKWNVDDLDLLAGNSL